MKALLLKLISVVMLAGVLLFGWLWMDYQAFLKTPLQVEPEGATVLVEPGTSLKVLARRLEQQGMLSNREYFGLMARLQKKAASIQAGEYRIAQGTKPEDLLAQLVDGKVVAYSLRLVEGWNFRQVREAIRQNGYLSQTLSGLSDEEVMARIGRPGEHPEGRFFPDTYHFPRGLTDVAFLQRAYRAMQERLDTEWQGREEGIPLKTPYEALILASIVEKETGTPEERPAISGVFTRRLVKGMRLQTDPTVIYGLGEAYNGNIRRADLLRDTPYNTYTRGGLPPTPIAMPGGAAIHAAVHPEEGKSLYFVARGDGSHYFSATLEEHNAAVTRYQLQRRATSYRSRPAATE